MNKECTKCFRDLPNTKEFFYVHSSGGLRPDCKKCHKEYQLKKYENNKFKYRKEHREYWQQNKNKLNKKRRETPKGIFNRYKDAATNRNISFELSFDQFLVYWQQPCFYCADSIETCGIDRMENLKGYQVENCIACCKKCNIMKNSMSVREWILHMKKIINNTAATQYQEFLSK